jgi:hypothetical protein
MSIKEFSDKNSVLLFWVSILMFVLLVVTIITSVLGSFSHGEKMRPFAFGDRMMMNRGNFQAQIPGQNQGGQTGQQMPNQVQGGQVPVSQLTQPSQSSQNQAGQTTTTPKNNQ